MFHTKNKQGVVIHPTSVFATDPEVLLLPEEESRDTGNAIWTQFPIFSGAKEIKTFTAVDRFTIFFHCQSRATLKVALFIL